MRLNTDQQEALLHLQRIQLQCDEARVARERQMDRCWDLGIPAARIAMAANVDRSSVTRARAAAYQRP